MFSQHGANNHSQCSGLVNISSPAVHSADAKLKHTPRVNGSIPDVTDATLDHERLSKRAGANVNQKLFRGFATTAAVREGHLDILEILLKARASQPVCEEALLEASRLGHARPAELLMGSDMIRPHVAVHALVTACCRGFLDVVDTLLKPYTINSAKVVFLKQRPQSRPCKGSANICLKCDRILQDPFHCCSLSCKMDRTSILGEWRHYRLHGGAFREDQEFARRNGCEFR